MVQRHESSVVLTEEPKGRRRVPKTASRTLASARDRGDGNGALSVRKKSPVLKSWGKRLNLVFTKSYPKRMVSKS